MNHLSVLVCAAAGIEPIITTPAQDQVPRHTGPYDCCTAQDMADLVEYCWGNESTTWGKQRFDDGHPEPYRLKYIELGENRVGSRPHCVLLVSLEIHE